MNENNKKNIIIILVDAFRIKNLSLYGYEKETDKNIKKIAKENLWFSNYFSASNSTAPALTSIFTGQYPPNHGIMHQLPYTKQEEIDKVQDVKFWFPEYLKNKGYETICIDWIGLWFKKGFDYYGEGEDFDLKKASAPFRPAKEMTDLAISKLQKNQETNRPFFLFMHMWDTHFPFPNTKYESQHTEEDFQKTLESIKEGSQREYLKKRIEGKKLYTIQDMINKYDSSIQNIDNEIGRIYDFLNQENLWEDTIFIVIGDHGTNLTEHEIYFSSSGLYEDCIHVPSIMHFPGLESKKITEFAQDVDILPSILDYIGLETENEFDGKSFLSLIKDNQPIRDKIFSFDGLCEDIKTVRTKNKKLIIAKDNFCNLCKAGHHEKVEEYDLEKDPQETRNIYSGKSELISFLE